MSVTVRIDGLERLMSKLNGEQARRFRHRVQVGVAEEVRNAIAQYPPPPKYPLRWASAKQRRYVLSMARRGLIPLPYVRQFAPSSQRLGPSWKTVVKGEEVFVGTMVTYAPYVQSHEKQQPFHADTGWKTDKMAAEEVTSSGVMERIAAEVFRHIFK